jgi:hypothetical protein
VSWTTPEQLREQVLRRWDRGEILAARITGEPAFPLRLKLARPSPADITERFDEVRRWARSLAAGSRDHRGFGYVIEWRETNHRVHGTNSLPDAIRVPTEEDALRLIRKEQEASRFAVLADAALSRFPELRDWLARKPLVPLEHATDWMRILAVLEYFRTHPRPGLYTRQLDIAEVDTKFIESRRALLAELLDLVLPESAIDVQESGSRNFERRYGLKREAPLIRFRVLDPAMFIQGLSDLSALPEEFARLRLPVRHVFITENKTNGLAFPDVTGGIVIFGLGYGLERLAEIGWLRDVNVKYWGDIDTHGFSILNQLRAKLPHARSFLMDRETLVVHRILWGQENDSKRFGGVLERLTEPEQSLFEDLQRNRLGERVRLEQERIGYGWILSALASASA